MTTYLSIYRLRIQRDEGPDALESRLDCVVEQLEHAGAGDADWTAALATGEVTFNFTLEAEDFQDAHARSSSLLHAALHGCEDAVGGRPHIEDRGMELSKLDTAVAPSAGLRSPMD